MRKVVLAAAVAVLSVSAFAQKIPVKSTAIMSLSSGQSCQFTCDASGRRWSFPALPQGSSAIESQSIIGDFDRDGFDLLLNLVNNAVSAGSKGENPLFEGDFTFVDLNNNPVAKVTAHNCWPSSIEWAGTDEIAQGHGLSAEFSSNDPIDTSSLSTMRIWDSRSQVWNVMRCSVDGIDTSNVVHISSGSMNITDPVLVATLGITPVTYSHIKTAIKTKNTNITDVYLMGASGKLTHMTLTYTNNAGNTLTVDLGSVRVARVTNSLLDSSLYTVDYEIDGPVSWSYK